MPKIQKSGKSHWVSIPASICKLKDWEKGQELIFVPDLKNGQVTLQRLPEPN